MKVNVQEAKTHFSRLLQRVQTGEEIAIAKAGVPVARLVPAEPCNQKRELGFMAIQSGLPKTSMRRFRMTLWPSFWAPNHPQKTRARYEISLSYTSTLTLPFPIY
jgi:prevent-host-death family protein